MFQTPINKEPAINYWFYILKEVSSDNELRWKDTVNVEMDVFIADDRAAAKKHLAELHPGLPFRKPKNAEDGTRYLYLTTSDAYWYNFHHGEKTFTCSYCTEETTVIGVKNIIRRSSDMYCSEQCQVDHEQMKKDNSSFINRDDHVGTGPIDRAQVIGYIYKITNKHTLRCYVGQTIHAPLFRWWEHLKIDKKFEQADIADLVFEVLEIVTFDNNNDRIYTDQKDKLNKREAHFIKLYACVEEGYNSVQPKEFEPDLFTFEHAETEI